MAGRSDDMRARSVAAVTATANGTVFARCVCRSAQSGRQLGARCPQRDQAGHGRWYIDSHVPGVDGQQKRLHLGGFHTRAAAEEGLAELLEIPAVEAMAETWTVERWPENTGCHCSKIGCGPRRHGRTGSVTRPHLIARLGRYRVADLDGRRGAKTVQRAVDAISRQEMADAQLIAAGTVHRIAAVLRSALNGARQQGPGVVERGLAVCGCHKASGRRRWPGHENGKHCGGPPAPGRRWRCGTSPPAADPVCWYRP